MQRNTPTFATQLQSETTINFYHLKEKPHITSLTNRIYLCHEQQTNRKHFIRKRHTPNSSASGCVERYSRQTRTIYPKRCRTMVAIHRPQQHIPNTKTLCRPPFATRIRRWIGHSQILPMQVRIEATYRARSLYMR